MKKAFQNLIRNYFNFTKGERNAFFVLCGVLLIITFFPLFDFGKRASAPVDFSLLQQLEAMQKSDSAAREGADMAENFQEYPERKSFSEKFLFNPNTATLKELEALGFRTFLAERIIKFRNAGGKFTIKSDIRKIYGISPELADELMPYIDLPESKESAYAGKDNPVAEYKPYVPRLIDLNRADTAELNRLRGIGNKLSMRIVNFREKLGGFYSLDQLSEVYGLKPEVITEILPRFSKELSPVRKLNINTASVEELGRHPYIGKQLAGIIVNYRIQHGAFGSLKDIMKTKVIDEMSFNRLENYLTL